MVWFGLGIASKILIAGMYTFFVVLYTTHKEFIWGDPLEREPSLVVLDVVQGKVSAGAARWEYGVVLVSGPDGEARQDPDATAALRSRLREARGRLPFFDRGPGYRRLAGRDHADVDLLKPAARPESERP